MCYRGWMILFGVAALAAAGGSDTPPLGSGPAAEQQNFDKSVVLIRCVKQDFDYTTPWKQEAMSQGAGSGFIISGKRILTNAHNVSNWKYIELRKENIAKRYPARVAFIGHDCDLATLTVADNNFFADTVPLEFAEIPKVNTTVSTYGFPLGGTHISVTEGVVSRIEMDLYVHTGADSHLVIQTDAAINPGNSGGPLVNLAGEVVGINTAGAGQAENIGFSIAIDAAKPTIQRAVENPNAPVAFMGVVSQTVSASLAYQFDLPVKEGAYVVEVTSGGPADEAGINTGDVITEFDGTKVTSADQLGNLIHEHQPGDQVDVVVETGSGPETKTATLGTNPLP